jgi:hypothetical protein
MALLKTNHKCLNAKTTSFSNLGFELDLAFEPCHLSLFGIWGLVLEIWDFVLSGRGLSPPYHQIE